MENIVVGEKVESEEYDCCTDIEKKSDIKKYGLPPWIGDAIADWNTDYIYITNFDNRIEIGTAQVNIVR